MIESAIELAKVAAKAAARKQATEITAIDVHERTVLTDVFLLVSADNPQQARAITDEVDQALTKAGAEPNLKEGLDDFQWVLLQSPGLIVHVFQKEQREYYDLERLWRDCPTVELPDYEDFSQLELLDEETVVTEDKTDKVQIIGLDLD